MRPKFSELFVAYLLTRNSRIEEDLIDQLFNSSEKRLARLLLLLANFGKAGKPTPIDTSINQETLAEMVGTTRSRVSFFMNKFRKLGLISYNGRLEVHRSLLNAVLYEKSEISRDEARNLASRTKRCPYHPFSKNRRLIRIVWSILTIADGRPEYNRSITARSVGIYR